MPIDSIKLTTLFGEKLFRKWVRAYFPEDLAEIDRAKRMGLPNTTIQAQVVTLYNKIYQSDLIDDFRAFITEHFPHVVVDEDVEIPLTAKLMAPAGPDKNGVFTNYNPNILRFPMQMMFRSDNAAELKQAVEIFSSRFSSSKSLIVGGVGYVEYIPSGLRQYADMIPESNWEILASRK